MSFIKELEVLITNRCDEAMCNSKEYTELENRMANEKDIEKYKQLVGEQQEVIISLCYKVGFQDCNDLHKTLEAVGSRRTNE